MIMSHKIETERSSLNGQPTDAATPDPEVVPKATRRKFSAAYKLRILREAEGCTQPGELGALLRREGLFSSYMSKWRRQRDRGELDGLAPKRRGRTPSRGRGHEKADLQATENARLQRENERLQARLERAEVIIEVHTCPGGRCQGKKLSGLLGLPETESPSDER